MIQLIVILFLAGIVLIVAEFFVPGMVCGALGVLLIIASTAVGCVHYPDHAFMIIFAEFMGAMVVSGLGFIFFPRTRAGKVMILADSQTQDAGWVAVPTDSSLMGTTGVVFTALRPAGTIVVGRQRLDAVSNGTFIDTGAKVRVVEVQGSRVVVEKVD